MKYTVHDLRVDFPDEQACLAWLVEYLYPDGITCKVCQKVTKHHPMRTRRSYCCDVCGHHVYPTAGTIFHNTRVPLALWYHAFYLMSTNKAGTSAMQLQREVGVTYKTAWRMMHKIRELMEPPAEPLQQEVEVDETYIHANVFKRSSARRRYGRTGQRAGQVLFGMVERGGAAKVYHVKSAGERVLTPLIKANVAKGTLIHSDGYRAYRKLPEWGYPHKTTNHSLLEFYTEDSYTQTIENVWSTMKPRWRGTFKYISPKYLQNYANEFAWRYSHRGDVSMFWSLMGRIEIKKSPFRG